MNKLIQVSSIVILLMFLAVVSICGQGRSGNYLRLSFDAGYAAQPQLESKPSQVLSSNGALGAFSVGYRLKKQAFLFDLGLGVGYTYYADGLVDSVYVMPQVDMEGESFIGHNLYTKRLNNTHSLSLQLPIMFGAQWDMIYFLAGVKLYAHIPMDAFESGAYSLLGEYDRFIDVFENMPTDGFVCNEPYEKELQMSAFMDARFCAELGILLNRVGGAAFDATSGTRMDIALSAFVECGVDFPALHLPVAAGVRLTMLFPMKQSSRCMCLE